MTVYISKKRNIKFIIPIYRETAEAVLIRVILVLSAISLILAIVCPIMFFSTKRITVEAGSTITAAEIVGKDYAFFGDDFDPDCLKVEGIYHFTITYGHRSVPVRLKVIDTKPPEVKVKDVLCAVGAHLPEPEDFVESVSEAGKYFGEYVKGFPEIKAMGTYSAQIRFTDEIGNQTPIYEVKMTVISDTVAPHVEVISGVTVLAGEPADYTDCLKVTDNCVGKISVNIDSREVDATTPGTYFAYATATDAVGNVSEKVRISVTVVEAITNGER